MPHRFKVGQMLELSSSPLQSNRPRGPCKVLACLPKESGPVQYRVKSLGETNERVVDEIDLSPGANAEPVDSERDSWKSVEIVNRR